MKKTGITIMLSLLLLFVGFSFGLLLNRVTTQNMVCISDNNNTGLSIDITAEGSQTVGKLNINTATSAELTDLPGIGTVLAERIIEYRNQTGSFKSIDELLNVSGIGKQRLESISQYITVGG